MVSPDYAHLLDAAGLTGVMLYLLAYGALQTGFIGGNSYTYAILNAAAASLIVVSLLIDFNLPSFLINVCFIIISLYGMTRIFLLTRRVRFSAEERFLCASKLPSLSPIDARRFLDAGTWQSLKSGETLTVEGAPVEHLWFVAKGRVLITLGRRPVATVDPGGFVGEIGALSGSNAGATATALTDIRAFSVTPEKLGKLCERSADIRLTLSASISEELGKKLTYSNKLIQGQE